MDALPDFSLLAVALPVPGVDPQGLPGRALSSLESVPAEATDGELLSAFQALLPALIRLAESGKRSPSGGNRLPFAATPFMPDRGGVTGSGAPVQFDRPGPFLPPVVAEPAAAGATPGAAGTRAAGAAGPPGDSSRSVAPEDLLRLADQPRSVQPGTASTAPDPGAAADQDPVLFPLPAVARPLAAEGERMRPGSPANPPANADNGMIGAERVAVAQPGPPPVVVPWDQLPMAVAVDQPGARSGAALDLSGPDLDVATPDARPGSVGSITIGPAAPSAASGDIGSRAPLLQELPVPPSHPRFGEEVVQRIRVMVGGGISQARLQLNPPELGALDIRISLVDDRATVHFAASHATARDALEAGLPRLRELLDAAGIALTDGQVSDRQGSPQQRPQGYDWAEPIAVPETVPSELGPAAAPGRIDLYA